MKKRLMLIVLLLLMGTTFADAGMVVYRDNFTTTGGIVDMRAEVAWDGYANSNCLAYDGFKYAGVEPRNWSTNAPGAATPGANVNAGPDLDVLANGFINGYHGSGGASAPWLVFTEEYLVDRSINEVEEISFHLAHRDRNNHVNPTHVAVRIDGDWYISDQSWDDPEEGAGQFSTSFTEGGKPYVTVQLDFQNASWLALNVDPGVDLSVGGSAALPAGNIDAFGYFVQMNNAKQLRVNVDTYQITQVPEPASLALLALGGVLVLRRRKN